jgi:hypothetical protein
LSGKAPTASTGDPFDRAKASETRSARRSSPQSPWIQWVRERVAFYGSTQAYWPVLALHGLEELGHKLNAMTRQGKWSEMAREVPDDVVHLFAAIGRYDQIAKAIEERFGGLTDALNARANAALPGHLPRGLIQDIRRIPHAFRSIKRAEA